MAIDPNQRPDPDDLLAQLQEDEQRARRGRLRIYFGASAGVGKTYAMLGAARREQQAGRAVLVGLVETHGRSETAQLLGDLPRLPLRPVAYRERQLLEFDLDAALARKPAVLLVDELAHSNVPGSRHPKRWQDVQELLDAGIDVWSTLNVQHLESLNDTVGAITGIRVHETVPDTVLDAADEVVLVDVTPDELMARLKEGKVYIPQQAERAAQNFFRKGNLIALREIALRRTAEHVEDDVRSYRVEQSITQPWNTAGAILACVGAREGDEQVVRAAARWSGQLSVRWHAAYVETPHLRRLPAPERDRILAVLKLAEELGAGTAALAGNDAAAELVQHAQQLNCATLVVGRSQVRRLSGWLAQPGMTRRLAALAPWMDIVEIGRRESVRRLARLVQETPAPEGAGDAPRWQRYAKAAGASIAITLAATPLRDLLDQANIVMLFLLGTVLVALRLGRGPAALAAGLNVAAFDFFIVEPRLSFAVNDLQYLVTFVVMLGVGLLTGQLTAGLRFQARIAASRERRAQSLFELTRDLSAALLASQVVELGEEAVRHHFGGDALVLPTDAHDELIVPADPLPGFDRPIADWAFRHAQPAGLGTSTLAAHGWHYAPLQAPMRVRGVLALRPAEPRWLFIPEQRRQLETLARQVAIALERVHYVEIAQQALVDMESERLRNALLAAISHDVRTPLTALIGLAESLAVSEPPLSARQADTAHVLAGQARELATLVNNLLEMARLQSGKVRLRLEWQSVEEVVGVALRMLRPLLADRQLEIRVPPDLPLVEFDATLMERVLVNLLENAVRHGGPPIELRATATDTQLVLSVRDHGPGLPASVRGREEILFEKFTRGEAESVRPGVGLGLAICKAVVDAHRGTITAANADGAGAVFTVRIPRRPPPELPPLTA
ncbi:DUF4118 domain-containing protein [Ramlibacter sp.]|uniref:DUF4118 domain-containing protein n=1 Tax=Ramlibacter sp. TaxID=1917967 RepID=UPI0026280038|nr:DUF4118 domain-containing protein [Ramlibacter sp.]MDB5954748.1 hypothetical protein [Ramlibacter sp.]